MSNFKYDGKIELKYQFTESKYYRQIENLYSQHLSLSVKQFNITGAVLKFLWNPTTSIIELSKTVSDYLKKVLHLIQEIENMRSEGHCILITKSEYEGKFSTISISFDIKICCILPTDLLQSNMNITKLENAKLKKYLSQLYAVCIKLSYLVDQFIKKHQIYLEKMNNNCLKEIDTIFLNELVELYADYIDEMNPIMKYTKKIHKINRSDSDNALFEFFDNDLTSNINVHYDITRTSVM